MTWSPVLTHARINDFLYMAILPDRELKKDALIFCAGVNITRFTPVTRGLHGLSSNHAIRGLQRVEHGVSSLALSKERPPGLSVEMTAQGSNPQQTPGTQGFCI